MSVIAYEKRDRIAYVTIHRPEAMNALGPVHNQELIAVSAACLKTPCGLRTSYS